MSWLLPGLEALSNGASDLGVLVFENSWTTDTLERYMSTIRLVLATMSASIGLSLLSANRARVETVVQVQKHRGELFERIMGREHNCFTLQNLVGLT